MSAPENVFDHAHFWLKDRLLLLPKDNVTSEHDKPSQLASSSYDLCLHNSYTPSPRLLY